MDVTKLFPAAPYSHAVRTTQQAPGCWVRACSHCGLVRPWRPAGAARRPSGWGCGRCRRRRSRGGHVQQSSPGTGARRSVAPAVRPPRLPRRSRRHPTAVYAVHYDLGGDPVHRGPPGQISDVSMSGTSSPAVPNNCGSVPNCPAGPDDEQVTRGPFSGRRHQASRWYHWIVERRRNGTSIMAREFG